MYIQPFELERYFARYEFSARYLLGSSDCDGLRQSKLLTLADDEMLELWDVLTLGYTESCGLPLLREEIARLYERISPEDIIVAAPEECIFLALNALLGPGDHAVCAYPGYQSLYDIPPAVGCDVSCWQPDELADWRFYPEHLTGLMQPNTKAIICNFPHNPTGYLPSRGDFLTIVDIARQHDAYVFSDEMYRFLEFDHAEQLPAACDLYEKGISLSGMSKVFGMAGVRIGWLATEDHALLEKIAAFKDYTTICSSAPSEILSVIALRAKERIVAKHLKRIKQNLELLDVFFRNHAEFFSWARPRAGTICFPRLQGAIGDSLDFCENLVQETGVMLLPSTVYEYGNRHVRLGFGRENMPVVLEALADYLRRR